MIDQNPKSQTLDPKQIQMTEIQKPKQYDLEERTFQYAKRVNYFVKRLPRNVPNFEIAKQLVRAACSVGANYIEANESLSKKDFIMRIKICRKEAKESQYWLNLSEAENNFELEKTKLIRESMELTKIFGAILEKCK